MADITIPPEAWISVANKLYEEGAFETMEECRTVACLAMLKAWPGMSDIPAGEFDGEQQ